MDIILSDNLHHSPHQ